jgi:hypothetical protein
MNPVDALMGLQKPDGSIGGSYANPYSTAEAIIGLAGIPLSNLGVSPVSHRAGLAVFYGDNSFFTTCVSFTENSLTGLKLLQRSGLKVETATNPTQGIAVCKIAEIGNTSNDCFGSMPNYWSYWQMGGNGLAYSVIGADQSQVVDGGVDAWIWGSGNPPPLITYQNICEGVAFVLPTATPGSIPIATSIPTTIPSGSTSTVAGAQTGSTVYLIFAAMLLILGVVIIYLIRSHRK